jgi:hypothetical protein
MYRTSCYKKRLNSENTVGIIKRFHKIKNNSKEYEIFSIKIQEVGNRRENVGR